MRMPVAALWWVLGATVPALATAGCTYSPSFTSGALKCSDDGKCPDGYTCSTSTNSCCLNGDTICGGTIGGPDAGLGDTGTGFHFDARPDIPGTGGVAGTAGRGAGGTTGTGGATGTGGKSSVNVSDYIGVWTFVTPANVVTNCDNPKSTSGTTYFPVKPADTGYPSTVTISDNGDGTLYAEWSEWPACSYTLAVDSLGAHGTDSVNWYCQDTVDDPQEFWNYVTFDIVTADGKAATHDAVYLREDDWSDGTTVMCDQTVHAPMKKN